MEAEKVLQTIDLDSEASRAEVHLRRAKIHLIRHDFDRAESEIAEAERIQPGTKSAFHLLVELQMAKEDYAAVDRAVRKRLRGNPESVAGLIGKALLDLTLLREDRRSRIFS